ncbi:hypothetical protein [Variovorax soli]|uniref:Type VI secretion system secreted protein VgrG n=1 Tax=Variovorax soli TaxID=376815 RepID=A0ABU1NL35_9BURK|nr:hypothetical protein [Variovorax soli]MDR6539185.1 hypothetical protein [Variovorax soli]
MTPLRSNMPAHLDRLPLVALTLVRGDRAPVLDGFEVTLVGSIGGNTLKISVSWLPMRSPLPSHLPS